MNNLRKDLSNITESNKEKKEKIKFISDDLYETYKHTIKMIDYCFCSRVNNAGCYNCYKYAFGVHNDQRINNVENEFRESLFLSDFVRHILKNSLLDEINVEEIKENDIVLYFKDNEVLHGGKIYENLVVSKWGAEGALWKHDTFEVPTIYGDEVKYYSNIQPDEIVNEFLEYYDK